MRILQSIVVCLLWAGLSLAENTPGDWDIPPPQADLRPSLEDQPSRKIEAVFLSNLTTPGGLRNLWPHRQWLASFYKVNQVTASGQKDLAAHFKDYLIGTDSLSISSPWSGGAGVRSSAPSPEDLRLVLISTVVRNSRKSKKLIQSMAEILIYGTLRQVERAIWESLSNSPGRDPIPEAILANIIANCDNSEIIYKATNYYTEHYESAAFDRSPPPRLRAAFVAAYSYLMRARFVESQPSFVDRAARSLRQVVPFGLFPPAKSFASQLAFRKSELHLVIPWILGQKQVNEDLISIVSMFRQYPYHDAATREAVRIDLTADLRMAGLSDTTLWGLTYSSIDLILLSRLAEFLDLDHCLGMVRASRKRNG